MKIEKKVEESQLKLSEADIKLAVEQALQYKLNAGELIYHRLNAGDFIIVQGESRRRVKGQGKGTADFVVIQPTKSYFQRGETRTPFVHSVRVTYIEVKRSEGKQSSEQIEFQHLIESLNCRYVVVRDVAELSAIL